MDYGFHLAGFKTVFAVDFDQSAIRTLNGLLKTDVGVFGDVDDIKFSSTLKPDVVIGGPPCQGFSVAGYMDPRDDRSRHVWRFLEVVGELKPRAFVMENVKHLGENMRWAEVREGLMAAARAMGYQVNLFVLRASNHGVAQNRDRMFMVGALDFMPTCPSPTTSDSPPTSREVLRHLPRVGSPGNSRLATAEITLAANPVLRRSPFAGMLFNGAGRPVNLEAPCSTLPASMGGNKTPIIDQRWLDGESETSWIHEYHAHLWEGGSPYPMRSAPSFLRRLSIEEAAALQSFPDSTPWCGPNSAVFRQIGNAVPPLLAKAVASHLSSQMMSHSTPRRKSVTRMSIEELQSYIPGQIELFPA
jgi:DNA (cytosine-5)-methyltransferase 1